ncbi:MAG: hypothetical protein DHS20C02_19280 [Micavibrio sp.]|nr:MAG: hypothetical protein DHS20C02_19280 [Micavibrio sp.]
MADKPQQNSKPKDNTVANLLQEKQRDIQNIKTKDDVKSALNSQNIKKILDEKYPNSGLGDFMYKFLGFLDKPVPETPKTPEEVAQQQKMDKIATANFKEMFKEAFEKSGLEPGEVIPEGMTAQDVIADRLAMNIGDALIDLEADGVLNFEGPEQETRFKEYVAGQVYAVKDEAGLDNKASVFAKNAVEIVNGFDVDVDFKALETEVNVAAEVKAGPNVYGVNQEIELTQSELFDLTPTDTHGEMGAFERDPDDGHMIQRGYVTSAEVTKNVGDSPTVTLFTAVDPAVNTGELANHDDVPNGAFVEIKGNGHTYYTDISSLPGLATTEKGQEIWSDMQKPQAATLGMDVTLELQPGGSAPNLVTAAP